MSRLEHIACYPDFTNGPLKHFCRSEGATLEILRCLTQIRLKEFTVEIPYLTPHESFIRTLNWLSKSIELFLRSKRNSQSLLFRGIELPAGKEFLTLLLPEKFLLLKLLCFQLLLKDLFSWNGSLLFETVTFAVFYSDYVNTV